MVGNNNMIRKFNRKLFNFNQCFEKQTIFTAGKFAGIKFRHYIVNIKNDFCTLEVLAAMPQKLQNPAQNVRGSRS